MIMPPGLRKLALTLHITASVGWIGALVAYLALVLTAFSSPGAELRGTWATLELLAWYVITPLACAALLTGLLMALGTRWGLFRHYWVLISLLLTLVALIVLLTQLGQISAMAQHAAQGASMADSHGLSGQLLHAGGGLIVLLVVQVLNIYKPRGITRYGWHKQQEAGREARGKE